MLAAIAEADAAGAAGELPIGAVVVVDGEVVGTGRSRQVELGHHIAHAETDAIVRAGMRLVRDHDRATVYTSVEPCPMCLGAIVMADIPHVVFAARDRTAGVPEMLEIPYVRRHIHTYTGGVLEQESRAVIEQRFPLLLRYLDGERP
jgi:tRNA(adenine34) deaminase